MLKTRAIAGYGWIRDLPDHRDYAYEAPLVQLGALPEKCDLRAQCPAVYDQGHCGCCTGNAISAAFAYAQTKEGLPTFAPSRLFIYYNERTIEGTNASDAGGQIRDGMKVLHTEGVCSEATWPYDLGQLTADPPAAAYAEADLHRATSFHRLRQTAEQLKGCLASGFPFVFGFAVYQSFETPAVAATGQAPMPAPTESLVCGHAVMAVGYEDSTQQLILRNSWGPGWGDAGYFYLPYAYALNESLAGDFWTVRTVERAREETV